MKAFLLRFGLMLLIISSVGVSLVAQVVGDNVRLSSDNVQGVPVHPAAGNNSYVRWANGTVGQISSIDAATGWFLIGANGNTGWVTRRYLTVVADEEDEDDELPTAVLGTWNLEWLKDGKARGFPENTYTPPGPSYVGRSDGDYQQLAEIILSGISASILILNEVNGKPGMKESVEMDRLVGYLGNGWAYELSASGGGQRVAILFNGRSVRRNMCAEFLVPPSQVQSSDIFARDPLVCHFALLDENGVAMNDLLVVALHLASGQEKNKNHNQAMAELRQRLRQALTNGTFPANETDILVGGDLNASRYDTKLEDFWDQADSTGFNFRTLSPEDGEEYPGTRLAGVPLIPSSKIDYLMFSDVTSGLGSELVQNIGQVRVDLLPANFNDWRSHLSDHIPVTVRIRVVADDDH